MTEIWRSVVGFEGAFEVSSLGNVRTVERRVRYEHSLTGAEHWRTKRSKPVSPWVVNSGYLVVHLSFDNFRLARTVHSLVAAAFLGQRPEGLEVCHCNGDRLDNRAANLRYDTRANNHKDKIAHGTVYAKTKMFKLNPELARRIRSMEFGDDAELVAKRFGVTSKTIRRIWERKLWKYA